jgi:hypothetical protein
VDPALIQEQEALTMAQRPQRRGRGRAFRRIVASDRMDMSVTAAKSAVGQVQELWTQASEARASAEFLQTWHDLAMKRPDEVPVTERVKVPEKAPEDVRKILQTSYTPNAKSLVDQFSQQVRVEGLRLENEAKNSPAWSLFMRNRLGGRQVPLWKGVFTHGQAYGIALPGIGRLDGAKTAAMNLQSARRGTAFFRDDFDEWPEFYLDVDVVTNDDGTRENLIRFIDGERVHRMSCPEDDPERMRYIDNYVHGMELCPVQRFGLVSLDGEAPGEVAPYLSLLRRIDQDTADRLVLQRYLSWMVRTANGIKKPATPEEEAELEFYLSEGDVLVSNEVGSQFGVLQGQPMDSHIRAREADVKDLSATSQVPSYRMLGLSDNIGAEAIAAADASLKRKMDEYKAVLGEQMESFMRLGGYAADDADIAGDFTSRTHWAVTETIDLQSLSQSIQALNADDRGIPLEMLWRWVPGWTQADTEEAKRLREQKLAERQQELLLQAAMTGGGSGGNDTGNAPGGSAPRGAGAAR